MQAKLNGLRAIPQPRLLALFRVQGGARLTRVIPDLENQAVVVQAGCLCFESSQANAVIKAMVYDLRRVLEDDRFSAALGIA